MATTSNHIAESLPREMQTHTYAILREVEGKHWWYLGRRRIMASFVGRIAPKLRRDSDAAPRILDVGCGTGGNLEMLSEFGAVEGVDVSNDAVEFCRARGVAPVKQAVAEDLPYDDGSFDLVTGFDVIEHLDDDVAGLREMRRVLRPGGRVLLIVPAFMWLWGVQDDVSNHRRRYRLPELRHAVERAGFHVERATYANITFFVPTLLGRVFMRLTGLRPASESNINIAALNGLLGRILGSESWWLQRMNFPFGVSIVCVARRD